MSGDGLWFCVLGPLAVVRDGEPVSLAGARRRALLSLLVLRARVRLSSDLLIEELWGSQPPRTARAALQMHIRAIRQALGPELPLRTVAGGYVLQIAPGASDVTAFERGAAAGAAALRAGEVDLAAHQLDDALALWRGPPLVELADMPSAQPDAARLEELRLGALEARIEAGLALGRHPEAVAELGPLIADHPYRERLRSQLILALYRCGRQADALAEYQHARDTLVDEFGLEPSKELQRLQRAILDHDASLDPPPLVSASPAAQAPVFVGETEPAPAGAVAGRERKTVTALVATVEGSAYGGDPEDHDAVVMPLQERMRGELIRFGGTVEAVLGATVVAFFGLPAAHEDDAERAVRAALALRDQARTRGDIAIRVAVTTGRTLVEPTTGPGKPGRLAGSVVDAALRLSTAVPPDGVLVDGATESATDRVIVYEPVRGSDPPADSWQALAVRRSIRDRAPASTSGPLLGRDGELAALCNALERVAAASAPALVTIVGAPGIGKSRLVREFDVRVAERTQAVRVLSGRSLPYGPGVSFWALGEVVKELAGILENDTSGATERKLADMVADAVPDGVDAELVLRHVGSLVGAVTDRVAPEHRAQQFAAWRLLFESLAAERPLVLVFEDLQWADNGLLDFVDELVEQAIGAPLLVLVTARPELLERRPAWGGGKLDSATLTLTPLSEAQTVRLIDALVGPAAVSAEMRATLIERAGGNPLYAEQYAQMLADRGPDAGLPIPESVRGMIDARLDALAMPEKRLLHAAAVVGQVFWPAAVAATQPGDPRLGGPATLRALERKQFVRRERASVVAGQAQYAFAHMLVRDVAYEQIPRGDRIAMHLRAADWVGSLGRPDDHAELFAHHHVEALQLTIGLGQDASAVVPRTRVALLAAGDRARKLHAFASAERFYLQALDLWSRTDRAQRADLLYRVALAAYASGEDHRAEALARACEVLLELGDRARAAYVEALLGEVWWHAGQHRRCHEHLDRAESLLRDEPDTLLKTRVLARLLHYRAVAGRYDPMSTREALALAQRLGADEQHADLLRTRGAARLHTGEIDAGESDMERALHDALAGDWSRPALVSCSSLAALRLRQARAPEALELAVQAVRMAERLRSASDRRWVEANVIPPLAEVGEWDEALARADRFLADSERLGPNYNDAVVATVRACLRIARDDSEGALSDQAFALRRAREITDAQDLCPSLAVAAYIRAESGSPSEARDLLDELLAHGRLALEFHYGSLLPALMWTADLLDRREAIRQRLPSLPWPSFRAARALLDGDPARAARILEDAGAARSAAFVRLRHHTWAEDGQRVEPSHVRRALEFFARVGATRYADECRELLLIASS